MQQRIDSLAQQVEHNTFNVGVLGSSPRRITQKKEGEHHPKFALLFSYLYKWYLMRCLFYVDHSNGNQYKKGFQNF